MSHSASDAEPLGPLADEFLDRYRRGERPALTEYIARHPELADQIRDLFPALVMMEDVRPSKQSGPFPALSAAPSERLGEFRILREIGRGGMGVVYEAEQESLGRRVALKVLPPKMLTDTLQIERFQREARAAARLHHSSIVPVFGVGEQDGTHYYVMQYIEGRPLDEILDELRLLRDAENLRGGSRADRTRALVRSPTGQLHTDERSAPSRASVARSLLHGRFRSVVTAEEPPSVEQVDSAPPDATRDLPATPEAPAVRAATPPSAGLSSGPEQPYAKRVAQLGIQVAEALEYAASQGVLHRDIKPSNLLLDVWGTFWLTDFGLAKASGTSDLTRTGDLVGTLRYLAPERFQGRADVRSDIYSLGLTLYEMLALRPAFDGTDQAELTRRVTSADVPRLNRVAPQLPRDLVTIIHKATAKQPADRYQTPGALAEDLRRFLDDRSILARRLSLPEEAARFFRRNPTLALLLLAVLVMVLGAAGVWLRFARIQAERRAEAAWRQGLARQAVMAALERAEPQHAGGRWQEAIAVLAQAESNLHDAESDELNQRMSQARADLVLAARLEKIRMDRAAFAAGDFAADTAAREFAEAFAEAGLQLGSQDLIERIRRSAIREQIVAAVDDWSLATSNSLERFGLMQLASATDRDPQWRNRLPGLLIWDAAAERATLERLMTEAPIDKLSPQFLTLLGVRLRRAGIDPEAFLRAAQAHHPGDFWLNYDLGMASLRNDKPAEAAGFFRAALVARPDCSHIYNKLGLALVKLNRPDEAIASYRRAVAFDPKNYSAHYNLAEALYDQGHVPEAMTEYRRAIEVDPPSAAHSHNKLGIVMEARGQIDEAKSEFRRAIACDPQLAAPHYNLGTLLGRQGQWAEAATEFRRAIDLDPQSGGPHSGLAVCLNNLGKADQAIAEYRRSIALDPGASLAPYQLGVLLQARGNAKEAIAQFQSAVKIDAKLTRAHEALANILLRQGRFTEARDAARRGLDAAPHDEPRRQALQQTFEQCQSMLAFDKRLPDILKGKEQPTDAGELLRAARSYGSYGRAYAAARLYAAALTSRPALADEPGASNRYDAACAAARAAASAGIDAAQIGDPERADLRRQAREWLGAELAARSQIRQDHSWTIAAPASGVKPVKAWKADGALDSVRDRASLEKLPAAERQAWQRLWSDVDALLAADPRVEGRTAIARRQWRRAADCYARALAIDASDDGHFWFEYAAALLLAGDHADYVKACGRMVERCGRSPELRSYHVARASTLSPDSGVDAASASRLARQELSRHSSEFWSLTEQGALYYRAGRFAEAATRLEQSLRANAAPGRAVLNWLWLALANQRLGKSDEARRWLQQARTWLDQFDNGMPGRAEDAYGLHLHNWLEAHVLRREAEALIGAASDKPGQPAIVAPTKK